MGATLAPNPKVSVINFFLAHELRLLAHQPLLRQTQAFISLVFHDIALYVSHCEIGRTISTIGNVQFTLKYTCQKTRSTSDPLLISAVP